MKKSNKMLITAGSPIILVLLYSSLMCVILSGAAQQGQQSAIQKNPIEIVEGKDWIPVKHELEIESGSALDFSRMGFVDPPAGKYGRVIARADGQFAFEKMPNKPQRFYGVNLCFGAHYLTKEESDRLAERLVRLGYNALRIHHYERDLVQGQKDTTTFNKEKLDQFDYLMAALIKRGIYLTTDLYVSRPVQYREIGIDRDGSVPMNTFKILVPVHAGAFENWKKFTRELLTHINPYTGRTYAEEPALAWLSMINEGNFGNYFREIKTIPEWTQAFNRWLIKKYKNRAGLLSAWKGELKADEDPQQNTVALPENLSGNNLRTRDCIAFLSDTERDMVIKMKTFLRDELGCRALISNANSWTYYVTDQYARAVYDYVDDHFYVDHPQFLEQPWRLPSRCPNTSPIASGATGGRSKSFTRLFDKPFTITEYNYSAPGRFRGVGGILTGALGALQGWGGIWRFAYSHSRDAMFKPSRMGYFDLASDPLSQAAERASLCLFLRSDMQMAKDSVAIVMTESDLTSPAERIPPLHPKWHWMAWITRVGTQVLPSPSYQLQHSAILPIGWNTPASAYKSAKIEPLNPYTAENNQLMEMLRKRNIIIPQNNSDPKQNYFISQTGEITINAPENIMILDTARTAGGYAPEGKKIVAPNGGVTVSIENSDATVWVSALDDNPIRQSSRLLITHLTDLQNSNIRYGEEARQTLLDWGRLPHLVRTGKASIAIKLDAPDKYKVWALSLSGKRIAQIPAKIQDGALVVNLDIAGDPQNGARMLYEVARN